MAKSRCRYWYWHTGVVLIVIIIGTIALRFQSPVLPIQSVTIHDGFSDEKNGVLFVGPIELLLDEQTILTFHTVRADFIGLNKRIPFVVVVEFDDPFSLMSIELNAGSSSNQGQIYSSYSFDVTSGRKPLFIELTHVYGGYNYNGKVGDFDESEVLVETNEDSPNGRTYYCELTEGRVFWFSVDRQLNVYKFSQHSASLPSIDTVLDPSDSRLSPEFVKNIQTWFRRLKRDIQ